MSAGWPRELKRRFYGDLVITIAESGFNSPLIVRVVASLGLGTHLFVKVPRPGDSEGTFSVFQVKLPPVTTSLITQR